MTLLAIYRDDSKICTSGQDSGLFYKLYPIYFLNPYLEVLYEYIQMTFLKAFLNLTKYNSLAILSHSNQYPTSL